MNAIIGFIRLFLKEINKTTLVFCTLFAAALVFLNYRFQLEYNLVHSTFLPYRIFTGHLLVYCLAFYIPCLFYYLTSGKKIAYRSGLFICIIAAPFLFAIKVCMDTSVYLSANAAWNKYWNEILYWPVRMLVLVFLLWVMRLLYFKKEKFFGLTKSVFSYKPYLLMVMLMVPLIALASTQPDFSNVYPKIKNILPLPAGADPRWLYQLLYELGYGTDFFSIEVFFRGFLVVGLMKWLGKDAILPMACFYCSIHFGKPLGECISSYFGGILLGIVSYHTRSIYGGLIVHLGIAWMMEIGGYVAANWQ
jgi:hypothetical protein